MPNLLPIPANAFSGGAVKVDNSPVDKFLLQNTYAKNAARQFAASKFLDQSTKGIMNQGNGIDANKVDENGNPDPKGRSDADDFGDAVKAWHDFSIGHGNELSNPRNPNYYDAQSQREQLYNNAMDIVRRSKEKVANLKAVSDRQKELEGKGMSFTDDALQTIPSAHARVMSGNYQAFDLNHQSVNPKPWSQTDDASFSNEVNKIHRVPGKATSTPAGDGKETISYDNKFDPLGLNQIYTIGATKYKNNLGFQTMIDNLSRDTGPTSQSLKDLYKSEYGTDATHPEDIAAAYALSKNGDKGIEPKTQNISPNSQIAQQQKVSNMATQSNLSTTRQENVHDYKVAHPAPGGKTPKQGDAGIQFPGYGKQPKQTPFKDENKALLEEVKQKYGLKY